MVPHRRARSTEALPSQATPRAVWVSHPVRTDAKRSVEVALRAYENLALAGASTIDKFDVPAGSAQRRIFRFKPAVKEGSAVEILLTLPNEITLAGPVRVRCLGRIQRTENRAEGTVGVVAAIERYEFLRASEAE